MLLLLLLQLESRFLENEYSLFPLEHAKIINCLLLPSLLRPPAPMIQRFKTLPAYAASFPALTQFPLVSCVRCTDRLIQTKATGKKGKSSVATGPSSSISPLVTPYIQGRKHLKGGCIENDLEDPEAFETRLVASFFLYQNFVRYCHTSGRWGGHTCVAKTFCDARAL